MFSNELETPLAGVEPGDLVLVEDYRGIPVGVGYANPRSLISVRLLAKKGTEVGPALIRDRIMLAKGLRERFYPGRDTYRAVFSESDLLPGLVVDRYAGWLAVQVLTAGMERFMDPVLDALDEAYRPEGVVLRNDSPQRTLEGLPLEKKVIKGDLAAPVEAVLAGLRFRVDLIEGQKTGFFLDQVDNYQLLDNISRGESVLDLFCHTGAWSLYAAKHGAARVVGVDSSVPALALAEANARQNGLHEKVEFVREDAFAFLKGVQGSPDRYGVVVADPPSFIKNRARIAEGLKGYTDLNIKAMKALAPGGFLVSCSCSHHMDRETFREMLRKSAAGAGRTLRLIEMRSQSKDHPVLIAAPETEYLKCALLQVV